jgi:hypothetical protein
LSPAGKVNDAQAPHPESYGALRVDALVVRTAVNNGPTHPADVVGINYFSPPANHAGYSAHRCTSEASTVRMDSPTRCLRPSTPIVCSIAIKFSDAELGQNDPSYPRSMGL